MPGTAGISYVPRQVSCGARSAGSTELAAHQLTHPTANQDFYCVEGASSR